MRNHRHGDYRFEYLGKVLILIAAFGFACTLLVAGLGTPRTNSNSAANNGIARIETATVASARTAIVNSYAGLPLSFEANEGQTDASVQFISHGAGYTLFLTQDQAVIALQKMSPRRRRLFETKKYYRGSPRFRRARKTEVIRVSMNGANPHSDIQPLDVLPGKTNYFVGNDPQKWRTGIPNYSRVKYTAIYPGVDLIYYGNQHQLEFDFVVSPGADTHAIDLHVEAKGHLRIAKNGSLQVNVGDNSFELHEPNIYQLKGNEKQVVHGGFVLRGDHEVGIRVAAYDHSKALTIDPALSYSTYIGGNGTDGALGIALDSTNNAFVAGQTTSTNFPTANAYSSSANSDGIAFVSKINANGTTLLYSTYLGGTGGESANGIAVDLSGRAYVTGYTLSTDFPVVNGFQTSLGTTDGNAFVSVIDTTQTGAASLVYSTYLGGGGNTSNSLGDTGFGIAADASGIAYVTGQTASDVSTTPFPTTSGAYQTSLTSENGNAFVTALDSTQSGAASLVYSTYLGGSSSGFGDLGLSVVTDGVGDAYLTGVTISGTPTPFPTTSTAYQTSTSSPYGSTFVAEIATTQAGNASLVYSSYFGGSGISEDQSFDEAFGIAIDSTGKAYVTGGAVSTDFPITTGAYQTTNSSLGRAFVAKFDMTQSGTASLIYSTFVGGTDGGEYGNGIAVDPNGNAFMAGSTSSTDFPTTTGAFQTTLSSGFVDAFMTEVNPTGTGLLYSTFLGGSCSSGDLGFGIALDAMANPYVAGSTCSTDFPTYPSNAFQLSLGGTQNAFVTKFAFSASPSITAAVSPSPDSSGWNNSSVTVTFTCLPGGAPIQSCTSPVNITTEGANQVVSGTTTDTASDSATTNATVNLDLTAPSLSISSPSNGATVSTPYVVVSGTVTDSLSGVAGVMCNGAPAIVNSSTFSCTVPLSSVSNSMSVAAIDLAGNTSTASVSVTVSMSTPTSIQVTPNPATISVGGTQSFTAIDQGGTRRPDATWSISDATIASLASDGSGTLTGVAAGQATLTAAVHGVTAQGTVTVVTGSSLSAGTVLWSAIPVSGFAAQQIVQAVPTVNGPDLYSIETDSSGDVLVRAFKSDGEQLWQSTSFPSGFAPLGEYKALGDNSGGIILQGGDSSPSVIDINAISGQQNWQYTPATNFLLTSPSPAVGQDGTVFAFEEDATGGYLDFIDGQTGTLNRQIALPISYTFFGGLSTACGGNGFSFTDADGPLFGSPVVGPDGSVYLEVGSIQGSQQFNNETCSGIIYSENESLSVLQVTPSGSTEYTTLTSFSGTYSESQQPSFVAGEVIPDGKGGVLATWTNAPTGPSSETATISDVGLGGVVSSGFSNLSPLLYLSDQALVLGDNGTAFVTDGTDVTAFIATTLEPRWTYSSNGGHLSFVAATTGSGVAINDSERGAIQLDDTGSASSAVTGLSDGSPFDRLMFISDAPGGAPGFWASVKNNEAEVVAGPFLEFAASVYGKSQGNSQQQRSSAAQAIPVKFTQVSERNLPTGTMVFTYTWSSSTGRQSDLSLCKAGESVFYPTAAATYTWPLPMVTTQATKNPTVLSGSAANAGSEDNNFAPDSYQTPYLAAQFSATQRLWWTCPYYKNGDLNYFVPDLTITRRVFDDTDNFWKYQITKSTFSNTVKLPNQ